MENYELYHYGIKGMRWGVRRYQNQDGSLTSAGKKRKKQSYAEEARSMSDQELRSRVNRMNLEKRYMNATLGSRSSVSSTANKAAAAGSSAGKLAKNITEMNGTKNRGFDITSQGLNAASKTIDAATKASSTIKNNKTTKKAKIRLESLSDNDLKNIVDRMELENQYSSLKKETVSRGKTSVDDVISIAGSVLAVGASATAIALNISKMRKGV